MRDFLLITTVLILAAVGGYYVLGELGVLPPLLGLLGLGGGEIIRKSQEMKELDAKAEDLKHQIKVIEQEKRKLAKDGVKDLSDKDEVEYWKNQEI